VSEPSRRIRLHREAQADIRTAFEWYEVRGSGLGFAFLRALTASIVIAHRSPERYPIIESGMRRIMLRGFPYHVIFTADQAETVLLAVVHQRQDPRTWKARMSR